MPEQHGGVLSSRTHRQKRETRIFLAQFGRLLLERYVHWSTPAVWSSSRRTSRKRLVVLAQLRRSSMALERKPSIVFVHGLWADGSCFSKLIPTLQNELF